MMTLKNLKAAVKDGTIELSHYSLTREHNGYVSTKVMETEPEEYAGEYGIGFVTYENNRKSTRYCWKNYYIFKNSNELKTLEKLQKLDKRLVTAAKLAELEGMPEVEKIECLGASSQVPGANCYDVQLADGSSIDIYTR